MSRLPHQDDQYWRDFHRGKDPTGGPDWWFIVPAVVFFLGLLAALIRGVS